MLVIKIKKTMSNFKKIAEKALKKVSLNDVTKNTLNENLVYPEGIAERMHPQLEQELADRKHSLGKHPIFPADDEATFEQRIMGKRFNDVAKRYKRAYDVDNINNDDVIDGMMPSVSDAMGLEIEHKKELEKLAEKMVREEFDMDESVVEIRAELVPVINMKGSEKNKTPMPVDMQFKNHDEMINANEEVYKRRFLNAMIQGAAKKNNHMFHSIDDELTEIDPRLPNKYAKLMSSADYMYYILPKMENGTNSGIVHVQFPTAENPKAIIYAQAMVFPVLVHELVKGVMELLSAHGLPKNKKIGNYVINKADFLEAEPWDIRLGPALWENFISMIEPDDFHLKHHVYSELAALPVREFNTKMREIMGGTKEGKKIIDEILDEVKNGLKDDEFNDAISQVSDNSQNNEKGFSISELLDYGPDDNDSFNIDELL